MPPMLLLSILTMAQASIVVPGTLLQPARVGHAVDVQTQRDRYSAAEWKALETGAVLTTDAREGDDDHSNRRSVRAAALIAQPPELVWRVLTDFEKRPQFLPGFKEVHVVRVDGNRVWLDEHLQFLLVNIRYRVINTIEPDQGVLSWVLDREVAHDIADTEGAWQVIALDDGKRTLLTYRARIDSGQPVPGFLESFLMKHSLPHLIEGLRSEVERRAAQ